MDAVLCDFSTFPSWAEIVIEKVIKKKKKEEGNHSVKSWKWCKMLPHKVLTVDHMIRNTVGLVVRLLCEWTSLGNS